MNVDGQDRNTDYLLSILIFSLMLNWFVYSTDLCSIDWYLLMSRIYFTYTNNSTVKLTPYDTENGLLPGSKVYHKNWGACMTNTLKCVQHQIWMVLIPNVIFLSGSCSLFQSSIQNFINKSILSQSMGCLQIYVIWSVSFLFWTVMLLSEA